MMLILSCIACNKKLDSAEAPDRAKRITKLNARPACSCDSSAMKKFIVHDRRISTIVAMLINDVDATTTLLKK